MRVRDDWAASLFTVSSFTLLLIIHYATDAGAWCEGEETAAGCFREWVNAAGNFLTVLIAGLGVWIAIKAWRAADRQANAVAIPGLDERKDICNNIYSIADEHIKSYISLYMQINTVINNISQPVTLRSNFRDILDITKVYENHIEILDKYTRSPALDKDIRSLAVRLYDLYNEDSGYMLDLKDISNSITLRKPHSLAMDPSGYTKQIQKALTGIEDFMAQANEHKQQVQEIQLSLTDLIERAKADKERLTRRY